MASSTFLGGGDSIIFQATVTLTDAQVKALPTASQPIVDAPGSNKLIVPLTCVLAWPSDKVAYDNVSNDGYVVFADPDDDTEIGTYIIAGDYTAFFTNAGIGRGPSIVQAGPSSLAGDSLIPVHATDLVGKALHLFVSNDDGDFTGGHASNTLRVSLAYFIVDLS